MKTTEKITVGLGDRSYPIFIGAGTIDNLPGYLEEVRFSGDVALITNRTVAELYGDLVVSVLTRAGKNVARIEIDDGEEYKSLDTLSLIYDELVRCQVDRSSGIIALGGGVVGDIAGFAAATFLRGIPYIQVPTTLLAQVDSSVGGKTAVNHPLGKNLIGAFNQPELVCIDIDVLRSLPDRELSAGLAEVVKYGIIRDSGFFDWLDANSEMLLARDPDALVHAIKTSCQIKADIVEIDEKESSIRAILNFGHTFGHAVESLTGYRKFLHGEAVSIGMVIAARASYEQGHCAREDIDRIRDLLLRFNLPVTPPELGLPDYLGSMMHDKKVKDGRLNMVFNKGIGDCLLETVIYPEKLFGTLLSN